MSNNENIKTLRKTAYKILFFTYKITGPNLFVGVLYDATMEIFALSRNEMFDALDYLTAKGHIYGESAASFALTVDGLFWVEENWHKNYLDLTEDEHKAIGNKIAQEQHIRKSFLQAMYQLSLGIPDRHIWLGEVLKLVSINDNHALDIESIYKKAGLMQAHNIAGGYYRRISLTVDGCEYVENMFNQDKEEKESPRIVARPWDSTQAKLQDLRDLRKSHMMNGKITIGRVKACQLIGIDPKTVQKHDKNFYDQWDNWEL